ncbi:MAG: DUF6624 domain-containing protein [Acidimicrobiales bacterium]
MTVGTWLSIGLLAVSACGDDDDSATDGAEDTDTTAGGGPADSLGGGVAEPDLRDELVAMQEADQAERTGEVVEYNDDARTDRLREIIDEHGWPTHDLVGEDGASAAWLIAQHSDFDVAFQQEALELLRDAVDAGQADPTELAYLEDRVAVNNGEPQRYGTQVTCVEGHAEPDPLDDPDQVDQLRSDVGLGPLAGYLADFEEGCAAELIEPLWQRPAEVQGRAGTNARPVTAGISPQVLVGSVRAPWAA